MRPNFEVGDHVREEIREHVVVQGIVLEHRRSATASFWRRGQAGAIEDSDRVNGFERVSDFKALGSKDEHPSDLACAKRRSTEGHPSMPTCQIKAYPEGCSIATIMMLSEGCTIVLEAANCATVHFEISNASAKYQEATSFRIKSVELAEPTTPAFKPSATPAAQNCNSGLPLQDSTPTATTLLVFFFHGVLSNDSAGANFEANLTAERRVVKSLKFCNGMCSTRALNDTSSLPTPKEAPSRAVIEEMDDHRVKTFLSLAGVANGLFFGPQQPDVQSTHDFTVGFGSILGPPSVWNMSVYTWPSDFRGKYQHDFDEFVHLHPDLQNVYTNFNVQRSPVVDLQHVLLGGQQHHRRHCANYLKLENAHYFASSTDAVLMPWQTSILGQYSTVSTVEEIETDFESIHILDIKDAIEYQQDTCGLKMLDARGGFFLHTVANATHNCWVADAVGCSFQTHYDENIYPNLAADGRL
ncbi:Lysosomal thioesterase ppt2-b, partial [Globisporangium splendens]